VAIRGKGLAAAPPMKIVPRLEHRSIVSHLRLPGTFDEQPLDRSDIVA